jgi:hypothetical protein
VWIFQRIMFRPVAPGWHAQAPTLSQMLAGRADPRVNQSIANRLRDWIKAPLLGFFIRVIEIKFIDEFIERHRKIGAILAGDARNVGEVLGAGHIVRSCFF